MSRHRRHRGRRRLKDLARVEPEPEAQAELDRLGPSADAAAASAAAAVRRPPKLIVETPERVAARQARDLRDGVKKADRRSLLYVAIGVVVAMVVVGILALIDSRGGF